MPDIYLLILGHQQGPYSEEQVRQSLSNGLVPPDVLAWHEGLTEWAQVGRILTNLPQTTAEPPVFVPQSTPIDPNQINEVIKPQSMAHPWYIQALLVGPAIGIGLLWFAGDCPPQLLIAVPFLLGATASRRIHKPKEKRRVIRPVYLWFIGLSLLIILMAFLF